MLDKPQTTILSYARRKFDIICLTEIKISKVNRNYFAHKEYNTYLNLPPDHQKNSPREGVATLVRKELCTESFEISFPVEGRATRIKLKLNEENFDCLCLYAPAQSDAVSSNFFENLLEPLPDTNEAENSIIIGDFNTVLDPALDRKDPHIKYQKPRTSKLINDHALSNSLVDPWRTSHPDKREYSWANSRSASRIDYALISAHLYHQTTDASYSTPPVKTDHKAFTLGIKLGKFKTGKGYPKV